MTRTTGAVPIAALIAAATLTTVSAQVRVVRYGDDRLSGITQVDVLVVMEPDGPAECGLSKPRLQEAALETLRPAGLAPTISEKAPSWFYTVVVHAAATAAGGACAISIASELIAQVSGIPEADQVKDRATWGSLLVGEMPLVRRQALLSSLVRARDDAAEQEVRAQLAYIGDRVRAANP